MGSQAVSGESASADDQRAFTGRLLEDLDRLENLLDEVSSEAASVRPPQGGWSVHEVVDHLLVSHRRALEQLRALLDGRPPGDAVPPGLISDDPFARSWDVLVDELKQMHRDFRDTLAAVPDDFSTDAQADIFMVVKASEPDGSVTVLEWVQGFDWKAFVTGVPTITPSRRTV